MQKNKELISYFKNLVFPVFWLFFMNVIILTGIIPPHMADYFFCIYFGGFFFYYLKNNNDVSIADYKMNLKNAMFWREILLGIFCLTIFYGLGYLLSSLLPQMWNIQFISFSVKRAYNLPTQIAFFFSAVIFPAFGQEMFYRKSIICFHSKKAIVLSTIIGSLLFAINDNLDLFGIVRSFLGGIGFSIPYIKTKNIYVVITIHYIVSVLLTLIPLIFFAS